MKCAVKDLKPGEQLAADVKNMNGQLMLAKGTVLTESHMRVLKTWGIETVMVVRDEPEPAPQSPADYPPEVVEEARRVVNRRFRFISDRTKAVEVVYELSLKRALQRVAAGNGAERTGTR